MLQTLIAQFCDLVLGPLSNTQKDSGHPLEQKSYFFECVCDEAAAAHAVIEELLCGNYARIALLGVERSRFSQVLLKGKEIVLMGPGPASDLLMAAQILIKSRGVDLVVLQDGLSAVTDWACIAGSLRGLKRQAMQSETTVVFVHSNSQERRWLASELASLCSPLTTHALSMEKTALGFETKRF